MRLQRHVTRWSLVIGAASVFACWHQGTCGAWSEFAICTEVGHQGKPDIWSDWVVWHDNRAPHGYDIYAKNLATGEERRITYSGSARNPSIDNGLIVWQDARNRDCDIYCYDLATQAEHPIYIGYGNQVNPSIQGDLIVWRTGKYPCWPEIWAYSLTQHRAFVVSDVPGNKWRPKVYADTIVWADYRNGNWDVYGYDVGMKHEFPIASGPAYQREVAIYGTMVAYQNIHILGETSSIGLCDLATGRRTHIPTGKMAGCLDIFDHTVVWGDYRNSQKPDNTSPVAFGTDIYGYKIDINKEFVVCADDSRQHSPAIYANNVVWTDGADAFKLRDIYGSRISKRIHVDANASGKNNGLSWPDAFSRLQDALAVASAGDDILVAAGLYTPDRQTGQPAGDPNATFKIACEISIYGGFPPGGGLWEMRDPYVYHTVLSGDLLENDTALSSAEDLTNEPSRADNCYHVLTAVACDQAAVLDGVKIVGGNASGSSADDSGGGILCQSGSPTLVNCTFSDNSAFFGGAVGCYNNSRPTLQNCVFVNNAASSGGAVGNHRSSPHIANCRFERNLAVLGGAVCNYTGSDPTLTGCTFSENSAESGGAIYNHLVSSPKIANCIFSGNSAQDGGAVYQCSGSITNCTIIGNRAASIGGGLYQCAGLIQNCIIWGNTAGLRGPQHYDSDAITYSCLEGGAEGLGCISSDPGFVSPGYWDLNGTPSRTDDDTWLEGDYHLKSQGWRWDRQVEAWVSDHLTSRCIDAGSPASAMGAEPISIAEDPDNMHGWNMRLNMGAYGGTAEASMPPHGWALSGDLNNDGFVSGADFMHWSDNWLTAHCQCPGDFDRSGIVDMVDFTFLALDWRASTPWSGRSTAP